MKFFIEIGSSCYDTCHQLVNFDSSWHGIMVEPVIQLFDNIHKISNVIYENVVIANYNGDILLYVDKNATGNNPYSGLSSIIKNAHPNNIIEVNAKCITLHALLKKHNVCHIDLLKIDAEGYDLDIIKQINFKLPPSVIVFEYDKIDRSFAFRLLESYGYTIKIIQDNAMAILCPEIAQDYLNAISNH